MWGRARGVKPARLKAACIQQLRAVCSAAAVVCPMCDGMRLAHSGVCVELSKPSSAPRASPASPRQGPQPPEAGQHPPTTEVGARGSGLQGDGQPVGWLETVGDCRAQRLCVLLHPLHGLLTNEAEAGEALESIRLPSCWLQGTLFG